VFSLLASQKPVCASRTNDPFFIERSFHLVANYQTGVACLLDSKGG
jgi:hypothetical protein